MFENEYEEYMKAVLGYPQYNKSFFPYNKERLINESTINNLYPEIYIILKPMVSNVCNNYRNYNLSKDLLESMTMEIYNNIESENTFVNLNNMTDSENRADTKSNKSNVSSKISSSNEESRSCHQCNPLLKDLIKILILNQIINNNKPPHPPRPPMMPYPPMNEFGYPPRPPRDL
ncbi:MAG: hypothetical protein IJH12_03155 [Clostridia bacterium]|nr:hypothetical protein [Clostridia bacterium]